MGSSRVQGLRALRGLSHTAHRDLTHVRRANTTVLALLLGSVSVRAGEHPACPLGLKLGSADPVQRTRLRTL